LLPIETRVSLDKIDSTHAPLPKLPNKLEISRQANLGGIPKGIRNCIVLPILTGLGKIRFTTATFVFDLLLAV
jgi:hypothetical protein